MDLQLLGPVEATIHGRPIPLGATKQRALLAMLALRANSTVSVELLVDGLWGEDPPATAPKMVQLYVSQLRRLLDGNGAEIVTHGRGYELRLDAERVDAVRFERLVEQEQAREALGLWRGDALANVSGEPFAAGEIRRLEELRLHATELAIDAGLAAGRHRELIGELERLVAEHPLSERLHAQRMLALYRSGRQSEALEAYRHARNVLVEEIGVEPGAELRALHDAVLRQDASLDLPQPRRATEPPERSPTVTRRRGGRWLVIAAALALLAGGAVFGVTRLTADDSYPRIDENDVGLIDPDGHITAEYGPVRGLSALADGGGSVWAASGSGGTVSRIPHDGDAVAIPVGGEPAGLAFGAGSLWVADRRDRSVLQINPAVDRVVHTYTVGNAPRAVAAAFGSIWVASEVDPAIARIDLARGRVTGKVDLAANPTALAVSRDALWAASEEAGTVYRIDPRSGTVVKPIKVGNGPVGLAVGAGAIWVLNRQDATVSRIDPATDTVTGLVDVGRDPSAIAAGKSGVWVANGGEGSVWRIDPESVRVTDKFPIGSSPSALALAGDRLWTAALPSPASHRGGTLRVEGQVTFCKCFDPGSFGTHDWMALSYDGLRRPTGAPAARRSASSSATSRPASRSPARTAGPTSSGSARTSATPMGRPSVPRTSGPRSSASCAAGARTSAPYYNHIKGAAACVSTPKHCDLSKGIEADPAARTITIRLTAPDPDLVHVLALPFAWLVPADHPFHHTDIPPGTGPYKVAELDVLHGARLVRNPHFHVWSQDARPDGYADQIVLHLGNGVDDVHRQIRKVQRGDSDAALVVGAFGGPISQARVRAIEAESAGQLSTDATAELDFMYLNVTTPPFDDERVRQAINYATDRRRMVELAGGADLAQPACDIVPVSFPGYEPACRYTRNPGPAGAWTGPTWRRRAASSRRPGRRGRRSRSGATSRRPASPATSPRC